MRLRAWYGYEYGHGHGYGEHGTEHGGARMTSARVVLGSGNKRAVRDPGRFAGVEAVRAHGCNPAPPQAPDGLVTEDTLPLTTFVACCAA